MPNTNIPVPAVAALKYELVIELSKNDIFDDPKDDDVVRVQIKAVEQKVAQQFTAYSSDFKRAAYLELSRIAEQSKTGRFREFMGLIDMYIPDYLTESNARIRYAECLEDQSHSSDNRLGP